MTKFAKSFLDYLNSIYDGKKLVFFVYNKDNYGASSNDDYLSFSGKFNSGTHINPRYSQKYSIKDWAEHLKDPANAEKFLDTLTGYIPGIEAYICKNQIIKFDLKAFESSENEEIVYSF